MSFRSSIVDLRFPSIEEYQNLPHVHAIRGIFKQHADFVNAVQDTMIKHGVKDNFVLFALHKHFDVPADHALVLETIDIPGDEKAEVVYPVPIAELDHNAIYPTACFVASGRLVPYKFAKGGTTNGEIFRPFLLDFIECVNKFDVSRVFSIKLPSITPGRERSEAEVPEYAATVQLPLQVFDGDEAVVGNMAAVSFGECTAGESHTLTTSGTHRVFFKKKPEFLSSKLNEITTLMFALLDRRVSKETFDSINNFGQHAAQLQPVAVA